MKRIIVTNNKKVESNFAGKAEIIMLENSSVLQVLREGTKIAAKGGRLLLDPTRKKGYFKSLVFFMDGEDDKPDEKSMSLLNQCIDEASKDEKAAINKESILTGILQNRDLNIVKSIMH